MPVEAAGDRASLRERYDSCRLAITALNVNPEDDVHCAYMELEIGNRLRDKEMIIQGYIDLGRGLSALKKYDFALQYAQQALYLCESSGTDAQRADANRLTGAIYAALGDQEYAESCLSQAYAYYEATRDTFNLVKTMGEMAIIHGERKEYGKCISLLESIYGIVSRQDQKRLLLPTMLNLSHAYCLAGSPEKGLEMIQAIDSDIPDSLFVPAYRIAYFLNNGQNLLALGRTEAAGWSFEQGLRWAENTDDWQSRIECLQGLAMVSVQKQNFDQLASYYKQILSAEDSFDDRQVRRELAEMGVVYDITVKDREMQEMQRRIVRNRALLVLVVLLSAVSLCLFWYKAASRMRKKRREVELLNEELSKERKEMTDMAIYYKEQKSAIEQVVKDLQGISSDMPLAEGKSIRRVCRQLEDRFSDSADLMHSFIDVRYGGFMQKLSQRYPELTAAEKRICAMLAIGFSSKDMAGILGQTDRSLNNIRSKIRKKIACPEGENLGDYLKRV